MAIQIPNGRQQFTDANGVPLAGGSVAFYTPGTTTPKATYQDSASTVQNTNPILLDSKGSAVIWGDGTYRQVVFDANGNQIWDEVTSASTAGTASNFAGGITVGGSGVVVSAGGFAVTGDSTVSGNFAVNNGQAFLANPTGITLTLQSDFGTIRDITLAETGGISRWVFGNSSGSSDFFLNRYDNTGFLNTPFVIGYNDGAVRVDQRPIVSGSPVTVSSDFISGVGGSLRYTKIPRDGVAPKIIQDGFIPSPGASGIQNFLIPFPSTVHSASITPFSSVALSSSINVLNVTGFGWVFSGAPTAMYFIVMGE